MSTEPTRSVNTSDVEGANLHESTHADDATNSTDSTQGKVFTCRDCGQSFVRTEAAKPGSRNPGTCAECYKRHRAAGKVNRTVQAGSTKKTGKTDRYTFTLDEWTNVAIDTLAVGKDRSTVVEQAIALMLGSDPAAQAFVEHRIAKSQQ